MEPTYRVPHRQPKDHYQARQEKEKVNQVRQRDYIEPRPTASLMPYFSVVKVMDPDGTVKDIRMVYNGSKSRLNGVLFAPHFTLPTAKTA